MEYVVTLPNDSQESFFAVLKKGWNTLILSVIGESLDNSEYVRILLNNFR
ncbi:MAG: hypothetical protein MJ252_15380 [archaeon]|nr:hypothetical protein [archaeon]